MSTIILPLLSPRRRYFETASHPVQNKQKIAMDSQNTGPPPRSKPNKIIPVPPEFRRPTHASERELIVNEIKVNTGCTVTPQWDGGKIYQFGIFGAGAGLEQAIRYINQWISKAHIKSKDSSSWAKTPAFDQNKWYYDFVEGLERQRKDVFKGKAPEVPAGEMPLQSICVIWPVDLTDQGITPRDVFRNKLEALDAIRTQNEVFVTLLAGHNDVWQIEIQGTSSLY
jgi:hypothetical protein